LFRHEWKATYCTLARYFLVIIQNRGRQRAFVRFNPPTSYTCSLLLPASPLLLICGGLADVQTKALAVEVDLIAALLQNLCNVPGVLKLPQVNVTPALLDRVTDQLGRACLTLCAHDGGLLLLAGFVDDEGGALRFLLGDLLGLDCGCELGGEGEVLVTMLVYDDGVEGAGKGDGLQSRRHRRA
jgi:hypothetical protein